MDPIHPITPRPQALPEIAPAPSDRAAREERQRRGRERSQQRAPGARAYTQRKPSPTPRDGAPAAPYGPTPQGEGEDGAPHIDVRV